VAIVREGLLEPKTLGQKIRRARLEKRIFAKDLARLVGCTEDTILFWERDEVFPQRVNLRRLKEVLNI